MYHTMQHLIRVTWWFKTTVLCATSRCDYSAYPWKEYSQNQRAICISRGTVLLGMGFCFWMFAQRHLSGSSWKKTVETRTDLHCTRHRRVTQRKTSLPSSLGTVRISRYCIRVGIGSWWIGDITFVIRDEGWCRTKSVLNKTELLASQKGCLWRNKAGLFLSDWPPSIQHTQFCVSMCAYIYI